MTRTEDALPADAPPAELVRHRVRARAGDDDLGGRGERQRVALVAQQGHRFLGRLEGPGSPSGHRCVSGVGVDARHARVADARLVEQAELELQRENPPHCLIDPSHRDQVRVHGLKDGGLPLIGAGHVHGHVDTGVHGLGDRLSRVGRDVVGSLQCLHVLVVADHDALEVHLVAQDVGQQVVRPGGRHAVDGTGVHHDSPSSGLNTAGVGRKDHTLQIAQWQQRLVAVVTVDRLRIAGEVLDRCRHAERTGGTARLHALDVRAAQCPRKHRRFGPGLVCTSPPVVAGQILDWGEDPVPAGRADRVSGRSPAGASRRWIPGGAHADGLGVERRLPWMAEAVHCVNPEDQRNVSREFWIAYCWIMLYSLAQS